MQKLPRTREGAGSIFHLQRFNRPSEKVTLFASYVQKPPLNLEQEVYIAVAARLEKCHFLARLRWIRSVFSLSCSFRFFLFLRLLYFIVSVRVYCL